MYSEIAKLKTEISENLKFLKKNNVGFESLSSSIEKSLEESKKQVDKLKLNLLNKVQEIYQDNKGFQKELNTAILSRLEKNKSDIQVVIRDEGTQIQRAFENTLTSSFNNMESKFKEQFTIQTKQLNALKILLFLVIGLGIGLAIGLYLK